MKTATGEVPQFYGEAVARGLFRLRSLDMVQAEIERLKGISGHYSGIIVFSSKPVCADCGAFWAERLALDGQAP